MGNCRHRHNRPLTQFSCHCGINLVALLRRLFIFLDFPPNSAAILSSLLSVISAFTGIRGKEGLMKTTKNLRRRRRVTLAAISTGGLLAIAGTVPAAPLGSNLVVNGGFENVNLQSTGAYNGPQILDWSGLAAFAYSHDGSSSSIGVVPNYADGAPPPGSGHWYFTSN